MITMTGIVRHYEACSFNNVNATKAYEGKDHIGCDKRVPLGAKEQPAAGAL